MGRTSSSLKNRFRLQVESLELRLNPAPGFLYDNGAWVTGAGDGFGGQNTSALYPPFNAFGFNQRNDIFHVADDFVVDGIGWYVYGFVFTGYQTGSTTTSPFNGIFMRLWDGSPGAGGVPLTAASPNLMTCPGSFSFSLFSSVYRVQLSTLTNNQRPAMYNYGDSLPGCWPDFPTYLPPGDYWIETSLTSTGGTGVGVWANPTVPNNTTDNARQFNVATNTWAPIVDTGSGLGADLPFLIYGELPTGPAPGNQNPGAWAIDDLAKEFNILPGDQGSRQQPPAIPPTSALDEVFASIPDQPLPTPAPTTTNVSEVFNGFELELGL